MEWISQIHTGLLLTLGLPGLVFIIWYGDIVRMKRIEDARETEIKQYRGMISDILHKFETETLELTRRLGATNTQLCENYEDICKRTEKLYYETLQVVSLNTQTSARLVEKIDHIMRNQSV